MYISRALSSTLSPARDAALQLSPACTPARWLSFTHQVTRRLDKLPRRAAWTNIMARTRLRLCQGPLFGRTLNAVLSMPPRESRVTSATPRACSVRQDRTGSLDSSAGRRCSSAASHAECRRMPTATDHAFLRDLLNGRHEPSTFVSRLGPNAAAPHRTPEHTVDGNCAACFSTALIARAARVLAAFESTPGAQSCFLQPLAQEWSAPLAPPSADRDLLTLCLSAGEHQPRTSLPAPDRAAPPSGSPDEADSPYLLPRMQLPAAPIEHYTGGPERENNHSLIQSQANWFQAPQVKPSAWRPGEQVENALPAEPGEALGFDWSLPSLSSAMKRILDEDARRHGIDV
jgi:hypothetical protein